ncbi:amino acid ABC transporter substrate-binding protein [Bosea rubneri]|uniref:Amino acid ABC transporter substrate-binding protein n=1 Tax=Bosea rubneri TaxID=3075434 RepID=A0ABU3S0Y7_9HYPH|nr:amino acid ABC transporter substrate-binding protein [Bosea sp. ZW T0_25]MDU0338454.1 amino acid ABC transporter substrate-binding protein [Bosea sp. ZW T0_25]
MMTESAAAPRLHRKGEKPMEGNVKLDRRTVLKSMGAAVALPAIGRGAQAQATETIVIGGSVPLSGRAAETGLNVNNGYLAAQKFFNEQLNGVEIDGKRYKIDVRLFDDASDPARASTLIQRHLDDGVQFFLGSFGSNIVLPTAAIVERAGKPMMQTGGASDQIYTQGYKNIFCMFPRASRQLYNTVEYFKVLQPAPKSIMFAMANDAFSKTLAEGAIAFGKEKGLPINDIVTLPENITDASSLVNQIRSKKPDVLLATTHDQNSLLIARQLISSNVDVPLLYLSLGPQLKSFRDALGGYSEGLYFQQFWDERSPYKDAFFGSAQKFADYYRQHFKRDIAYHTASGAACIVAYVHAMKAANSLDPAKVRDKLATLDVESLYGRIKFTPEGDGDPVHLGSTVGQVLKGTAEVVFPEASRTAAPVFPAPKWAEKRRG